METSGKPGNHPIGNIPRGMEEPIRLENYGESMDTRPGKNDDFDFNHSDDNPPQEINVDVETIVHDVIKIRFVDYEYIVESDKLRISLENTGRHEAAKVVDSRSKKMSRAMVKQMINVMDKQEKANNIVLGKPAEKNDLL